MGLLTSVDTISQEPRLSNKFDTVLMRLTIRLIMKIVAEIVSLPNILHNLALRNNHKQNQCSMLHINF